MFHLGSTGITTTRPSLKLVREFLQIRGKNCTIQLSLQSTKPYVIKLDSTHFWTYLLLYCTRYFKSNINWVKEGGVALCY